MPGAFAYVVDPEFERPTSWTKMRSRCNLPPHPVSRSVSTRSPRLLHALGICVLQPAVPAATLALFKRYIFDDGELAPSIPPWVLVAITVSGAAVVTVLIGGLLLRAGRMSPMDIGWRRESALRAIGLGLAGAALATGALLIVVAAFGGDVRSGLQQMLHYSWEQRILFASVGVSLAVAEESMFRGYLQSQLTIRTGFPTAYLLTAVVYALWHFPMFHLDSITTRFGQGLVYGALRGRDRSVVTPTIAHAVCWAFVGLY